MPQNKAQTLNTRLDVDFAVKAAQLGVWELDPSTDMVIWDDRCRELFGVIHGNLLPYSEALTYIHLEDVERVDEAVKWALNPESGGVYDETYRTFGVEDGNLRWARFIGRSQFDESGKAYRFAGIALEMTQEIEAKQREQALIENRERDREQKLQLLSVLTASEKRFQQLISQAPVAIALFEGPEFVIELANKRMQVAASRMSVLISDLLTYSRISTNQQAADAVSLSQTLNRVLKNLSLSMAETNAKIEVTELPVVQGDPSQLEQLFQNLLSNALKFRRQDETGKLLPPDIHIHSKEVSAQDIPSEIKPTRLAERYHQIEIVDEGIGFDDKYADRIFQVFQRLHGKCEFPGTGIGLAICEKVVLNHGGTISVVSQPDKGATFSVYLPKV